MRLRRVALAALLAAGAATAPAHAKPGDAARAAQARAEAARLMAAPARELSVAQLAGQRLVFAYDGLRPPPALVRRIAAGRAAGVVLFSRNVASPAQTRRATRRLQRAARRSPVRLPLLVMVDQEGGPVRRVPGGPRRSAAAVGLTGSARVAQRDGRRAGEVLRAAGANVDLAPVVDVCRPGSAIEAERRCYGRRAAAVTRLARGFARGLASKGVAAALKHFPGLGAARVNTDAAPVTIRTRRRMLRAKDERPFAALASRDRLVMVGSAIYTALDRRRPAVLSPRVVGGELRGRIGFRGVTVSDALDTPALTRFGGPATLGRRAARAGIDVLLFAGTYDDAARAARGLERGLRAGKLRRPGFERSVRRILRLRQSLTR